MFSRRPTAPATPARAVEAEGAGAKPKAQALAWFKQVAVVDRRILHDGAGGRYSRTTSVTRRCITLAMARRGQTTGATNLRIQLRG